MKIVLDTNVFVSGIFWSGPPHKIVTLWAENKITIMITKKILNEYFRILNEIDKNGEIAKKWCTLVIENCPILEDKNYIKICRDPDDNKFLDCALTGKADYLVSGDKDLLSLNKIETIKIITPAKFLKIYG